jgi:hypothetical protein
MGRVVFGLADRKGWTLAELADLTIPTAGLDDQGVLTLDFGPRQFTAMLNEDLEFMLADHANLLGRCGMWMQLP